MKTEWEKLGSPKPTNTLAYVSRMKVFGGWIVASSEGVQVNCMVFVPDENHQWVIEQ